MAAEQVQQTPTGKHSAAWYRQTNHVVIGGASVAHFLNDAMQSLLVALYPLLKGNYDLSYVQIGFLTFAYQVTASVLQPLVGAYTDKHPKPYLLPSCAALIGLGLVLLTFATNYPLLLTAALLIGIGSSFFHPEASRIARLSSGGRFGFAQSWFQVGGNAGSAISPLIVAALVIPFGQPGVAWYYPLALLAFYIMFRLGTWYRGYLFARVRTPKKRINGFTHLSQNRVRWTFILLLLLIFSKYVYFASMSNFLMFFMIEKFAVTVAQGQMYLFTFLGAVALGTVVGGPLGDKMGRKAIIWLSILGATPFALLLPHADLFWAGPLIAVIGFTIASAFPAIVVFGQELMPHRVGMAAGLLYGFAFGMAGATAVIVGRIADHTSVATMFELVAYSPLLGIIAVLLPSARKAA